MHPGDSQRRNGFPPVTNFLNTMSQHVSGTIIMSKNLWPFSSPCRSPRCWARDAYHPKRQIEGNGPKRPGSKHPDHDLHRRRGHGILIQAVWNASGWWDWAVVRYRPRCAIPSICHYFYLIGLGMACGLANFDWRSPSPVHLYLLYALACTASVPVSLSENHHQHYRRKRAFRKMAAMYKFKSCGCKSKNRPSPFNSKQSPTPTNSLMN